MKYVYAVISIVRNMPEGVTNLPLLGVHTSFKKAMRHYNSVVNDRQFDSQEKRTHVPPSPRHLGIAEWDASPSALITSYYSWKNGEQIRLERWKV